MPGIILVTPAFLKPIPVRQLSARQKKAIKEFTARRNPSYNVTSDIEGLLQKLNTVKKYEEIPDKIKVTYGHLLSRGIDLKDTFDVINLTARLAASRFNEKPKEILVSGILGYKSIDMQDCKKLISAGFVGCTLSPMIHGIEAAEESANCNKKDPSYWDPLSTTEKITIVKNVPLEITLTFRQEQILQLILKGMTNHQISRRLTLSESTVKMHIGIILKKYAVKHRTQLILLYIENKL